ncbi:MAG: LysM peptidoglycan-binding domain-containing protein [Clostridia bacterium]
MIVLEGESLAHLSLRAQVPLCMLLRANRLYSPAWLLPGRELFVPTGDFCATDTFPCPVSALHTPAAPNIDRQGD